MQFIRRVASLGILVVGSLTVTATQPPERKPSPPQQQEEFVPIDQLPPDEQLPAAPMVVAAYAFVWVAFLAYVFTLVRRVRRIEADLAALTRERH